jgi:hypothetical protein
MVSCGTRLASRQRAANGSGIIEKNSREKKLKYQIIIEKKKLLGIINYNCCLPIREL